MEITIGVKLQKIIMFSHVFQNHIIIRFRNVDYLKYEFLIESYIFIISLFL